MELETINRLYLELSQVATAKTANDLHLEKLQKAAFDFFAWYNRTYPETPSVHPDHPWCKLGEILGEADRHG